MPIPGINDAAPRLFRGGLAAPDARQLSDWGMKGGTGRGVGGWGAGVAAAGPEKSRDF